MVLAGGRWEDRHRTDTQTRGPGGAEGLSRAAMRTGAGLFVGAAVAWMVMSGLLARKWPWELYGDDASQSDVPKLALGVVAAGGAAIALVVNYRRQQHLERDDSGQRDQVRLFTERFGAAAAQLGGDRPAVRLAGVYAMAAPADEWDTQRQQCIDVLCGYLRLPYAGEPPPGHPDLVVEQRLYAGGTIQRTETTTHQAGEIQVRRAIVDTIRHHVQPTAQPNWSSLNLDFIGATLIDASFRGARFSGEHTSFDGATFSGQRTTFDGARFSGSTWFRGARFSGKTTSFGGARFSGKHTSFDNATFSAEITSFKGATFSGKHTSFSEATFSGEATVFSNATFTCKITLFEGATFFGTGALIDGTTVVVGRGTLFDETMFSGKHTSFNGAMFCGQNTSFDRAIFSGELTMFARAMFTGELTSFGGARFADVDRALNKASISARRVDWGPVPPRSPWPRDPSENN